MNRFKSYRIRAGLTQQDVAVALGISQVSVWQWENGETLPRADRLIELSELYHCTIDELLGRKEA